MVFQPTKLLVKLFWGNFWIFLKFCSFCSRFLNPKNYRKIITGVWKECNICQNYSSYWKYMLTVLAKSLGYLFLSYLLILLRFYLALTVLFPSMYPKIVTSLLNKCGIVWIKLCPLECISKFLTELLIKLCFGNFQIFLKPCLLFKTFALKKQSKKSSKVLVKGVASGKLCFNVWNTC